MISREEVLNLAVLARLKLAETEVESLQDDISSILDYVGQVSAVSADDATGSKPELRNVLRADAERAPGDVLFGKEESLRAAFPERRDDFNVVRKIIQKDE